MATSTIRTSDLDFDNIKSKLKTELKKKSEFADYDFEASGLNNILDVLAFNTHLNGLTANFSLNESFLTSAQLRSSVVSHAQTLGYEIKSRTAARAFVNLSLNLAGVSGRPAKIELAANTLFTSSIDDVSYTFRTTEAFFASDDGTGLYNFVDNTTDATLNIPIFEGVQKTKTFIVGEKTERQIYIIPDDTIDTSTASVKVFETASSSSFTTYTPLSQAITVDANSTHFSIFESPNGFYELNFGDGVSFGKAPEPGEKVVVTYLSTKGPAANNGTVFTPNSQITLSGVNYTLGSVTSTESTGGADRQSIESIRQLAPIAYASQKRLVTSADYKAIIETNFSQVKDAAVWSGDQNIPKDFGAVYISLNFVSGTSDTVKQTVKDSIINNYADNLSVMSMTHKFVDPINVFLEVATRFNFDPALTGTTLGSTEKSVFEFMKLFFANNIETFDKVFRKSNLITEIDSLDKSILNSSATVKMQMREDITPNALNTFELNFPVKIATADDVNFTIESDAFEFNGVPASIKNKLASTTLQIVDLNGNILLDDVGQYTPSSGKVNINSFQPSAMISGSNIIKIKATPADDATIKPLRNYILTLDTTKSSATAEVDNQTVSLKVS